LDSVKITPEVFEAANEALRNTWLKQIKEKTGKAYGAYRGEKGEASAKRLLETWKWAKGNPNY
jgi:hypothetical protein